MSTVTVKTDLEGHPYSGLDTSHPSSSTSLLISTEKHPESFLEMVCLRKEKQTHSCFPMHL